MTCHQPTRPAPAPAGELLPAVHVSARYGISKMTLWRWIGDARMGFPKPIYINRRRYFYRHEIEAWERERAAARG